MPRELDARAGRSTVTLVQAVQLPPPGYASSCFLCKHPVKKFGDFFLVFRNASLCSITSMIIGSAPYTAPMAKRPHSAKASLDFRREALGTRLARLRKGAGFTQAEFAKKVGITQGLVSSYEIRGGSIYDPIFCTVILLSQPHLRRPVFL